MFGGDPFGGDRFGGNPFQHMHRQMREMDNMMSAMMGGGFGGPSRRQQQQMIQEQAASRRHQRHHPQEPHQQMLNDMMMPFGGGGLFGAFGGIMQQMEHMQQHALSDPNAMVFTESTSISFDRHGQPRVEQHSTRKVGDVKENRRKVQLGEELEEFTVGHAIGDRAHIIEKKRDKDGRLRQSQKFVNLARGEAERFNDEFKSRAHQNLRGAGLVDPSRGDQRAIGAGRPAGEPIVTVPDDDDDDDDVIVLEESHTRNGRGGYASGPTIREISDEEAEKSEAPKRRKGLFGKYV